VGRVRGEKEREGEQGQATTHGRAE
jgi:hypothetical protein